MTAESISYFGYPKDELQDYERVTLDYSPIDQLANKLGEHIFGQDESCKSVARRVICAQSGFADPNRPLGVFLFVGPTGVGKTELSKTLAKELYPAEPKNRFIRIDCTNYQNEQAISNLIGSENGYIGFGDPVRIMPKDISDGAVVVFDEVEKAHKSFWQWLMPVMEEGSTKINLPDKEELTTLDFTKTFLILTSNDMAEDLQKELKGHRRKIGFGLPREGNTSKEDRVKDHLKNGRFRHIPEFLARIDDIVVFGELLEEHYSRIYDKLLLEANLRQLEGNLEGGVIITSTDVLKNNILSKAKLGEFGARNIRHELDNTLISKAAEYKASGAFQNGEVYVGDIIEDEVRFYRSNVYNNGSQEMGGRIVFEDKKKSKNWRKNKN